MVAHARAGEVLTHRLLGAASSAGWLVIRCGSSVVPFRGGLENEHETGWRRWQRKATLSNRAPKWERGHAWGRVRQDDRGTGATAQTARRSGC